VQCLHLLGIWRCSIFLVSTFWWHFWSPLPSSQLYSY
jgi:hypothetical protein